MDGNLLISVPANGSIVFQVNHDRLYLDRAFASHALCAFKFYSLSQRQAGQAITALSDLPTTAWVQQAISSALASYQTRLTNLEQT